jgi:hypothetical protein
VVVTNNAKHSSFLSKQQITVVNSFIAQPLSLLFHPFSLPFLEENFILERFFCHSNLEIKTFLKLFSLKKSEVSQVNQFYIYPGLSLPLSLSLSLTHTHTHMQTHTNTLTWTHFYLSLPFFFILSLSPSTQSLSF